VLDLTVFAGLLVLAVVLLSLLAVLLEKRLSAYEFRYVVMLPIGLAFGGPLTGLVAILSDSPTWRAYLAAGCLLGGWATYCVVGIVRSAYSSREDDVEGQEFHGSPRSPK
jgi:hypothetical protein